MSGWKVNSSGFTCASTALVIFICVVVMLALTTGQVRAGSRVGRDRGRNRRPPAGCEEIYLPMCKGLVPYTQTKLPNKFNHTTQLEVYRDLERLLPYMDHSCSRNIRLLACGNYLPKCTRRGPGLAPCRRTCMTAKRRCARPLQALLGLEWRDKFSCRDLPRSRCLRPVREKRCPHRHPVCVVNDVMPACANLTFTWGTLPNMFEQCDIQEMNTEMQHFDSLVASNCHQDLAFLLCGVYSPFCVRNEIPFTFPCQEICQEVREACEPHYRRLNHNLPWPTKLQCHRYPLSTNTDYQCVMPHEGSIYRAQQEGP